MKTLKNSPTSATTLMKSQTGETLQSKTDTGNTSSDLEKATPAREFVPQLGRLKKRGKRKNDSDLTQEEVRYLFDYDEESGKLYWKNPRSNNTKQGDEAGNINDGYMDVMIKGKTYKAACIIWLWYYGKWPQYTVDHENQNKLDNSIKNLRDVTLGVNTRNKPKYSNNKTGFTGVSYNRFTDRYIAGASVDGKRYSKSCKTLEEAVATREELIKMLNAQGANFTEQHGKEEELILCPVKPKIFLTRG